LKLSSQVSLFRLALELESVLRSLPEADRRVLIFTEWLSCFSGRSYFSPALCVAAHDWLCLLSDVGSYALSRCASLGHQQRHALQEFNTWVSRATRRSLDESILSSLEAAIPVILTKLELTFPVQINTICLHLMHHVVDIIRDLGPVYVHWCYAGERFGAFLVGLVKSPVGPEVCFVKNVYEKLLLILCTGGNLSFLLRAGDGRT
jgi:hypothetical protein